MSTWKKSGRRCPSNRDGEILSIGVKRLLPNSKFFVVLKEESRIGGIPPIDQ